MTVARDNTRTLARAIARSLARDSGGGGGGGGGAGAVSSQPTIYQATAYPGVSFNNVSGAQSFNMPAAFQGGMSVVVPLSWFQASAAGINSVTVNGVAAVRRGTGAGSLAVNEVWVAYNVPAAGNRLVTITPNAGAGFWINAGGIECSPLVAAAAEVFASANGTSTTPAATTAQTVQFADLVIAMWRDNSGASTSNSVTAPLIGLFSQPDGANNLGAGAGYRITDRAQAQAGAFACSPSTQWFADTFALKFALPVVDYGSSIQLWQASNAWNPLTLSCATTSSLGALVSVASWWNTNRLNGAAAPVTTDSAGVMLGTINPPRDTTYPTNVQICTEFGPGIGTHALTPCPLNVDDDGCFAAMFVPGVTQVRCTGYTRNWHTFVAPPDPNTIQNCSVTTTGSVPQVGDKFVAVFGMDPNSITNADLQWAAPAGTTVLYQRWDVQDIVGMLTLVGVVTSAGHITLNPTWIDNATFWAEGAIAVYAP